MMERNRKLSPVEMRIALVNIGTVFHAKQDNQLALDAYGFAMEKAEEVWHISFFFFSLFVIFRSETRFQVFKDPKNNFFIYKKQK